MASYRSELPQWFAMVGRAVGRGEVAPDVDPAIVLHMMLSPAVSVSLFEDRALAQQEIDSLVTLVCRATAPPSTPPAKRARAAATTSTKRRSTTS